MDEETGTPVGPTQDPVPQSDSADEINGVKVFLINRRDIVLRGLRAVLEDSDEFVVVGEARGAEPSLRVVEEAGADIAIVDATVSRTWAVGLARALQEGHEDIRCLMLSHLDPEEARRTALAAGADGYLLDDAPEKEVRAVIRDVAHGDSPLGGDRARDSAAHHGDEPDPELTYRERQVLRLIAAGLTNRQIGARLGLAEKTVKNYISRLLAKLHVERRTQAAIYQMTHDRQPGTGVTDGDMSGASSKAG